jgi:hypothetical protein
LQSATADTDQASPCNEAAASRIQGYAQISEVLASMSSLSPLRGVNIPARLVIANDAGVHSPPKRPTPILRCPCHRALSAGPASAAAHALQPAPPPPTACSPAIVWKPFCRCLCFGFSLHTTRTTPFRFTILQALHSFFTDCLTFIEGASRPHQRRRWDGRITSQISQNNTGVLVPVYACTSDARNKNSDPRKSRTNRCPLIFSVSSSSPKRINDLGSLNVLVLYVSHVLTARSGCPRIV